MESKKKPTSFDFTFVQFHGYRCSETVENSVLRVQNFLPSRFSFTYLLMKNFPSKGRFKKSTVVSIQLFLIKKIKKIKIFFFIVGTLSTCVIQHLSETLLYIECWVPKYEMTPRKDSNPSTV